MTNEPDDEVLKQLHDLSNEANSAFTSFKKRLDGKEFTDVTSLAGEMSDLFSLLVDVTKLTAQAHHEHYEWAEGVDEDLDALKEPASTLLVSDAENLKSLILSLQSHLRTPDDDLTLALKQRVGETVIFIDSITELDDEDEDEEPEEPELDTN